MLKLAITKRLEHFTKTTDKIMHVLRVLAVLTCRFEHIRTIFFLQTTLMILFVNSVDPPDRHMLANLLTLTWQLDVD